MSIMGEAEVEICIGQLNIKQRALVANIEDEFILRMDLITYLPWTDGRSSGESPTSWQ